MRASRLLTLLAIVFSFTLALSVTPSALAVSHPGVAAGWIHTVGLSSGGSVVATGNPGLCGAAGWTGITQLSAGFMHTVGLRGDGSVVATGSNESGQCNVGGWNGIIAIAPLSGSEFTVGIRSDRSVVATGRNDYGQCDVSGWSDIQAVAGGFLHTVGLRSDKTVVVAGSDHSMQADVSGWNNIKAIGAGDYHTLGVTENGGVVASGLNTSGQCDVSGWTSIVAVGGGYAHSVGLRADGTVVATGSNTDGQCDVSGWANIVAIAVGKFHTVGLRSDGTVVAVGNTLQNQSNVSAWRLASSDDNIPGLPMGAWEVNGLANSETDKYDVWAVHLTAGVPARFDCVRTAGDANFNIFLYPPGANDVWRFEQWLGGWAWSHSGNQTETIEYTPSQTGVHYLLVDADPGEGAYRVTGPAMPASLSVAQGTSTGVYPFAHTITGVLSSADSFAGLSGVGILVSQQSSTGWTTVGETRTSGDGTFTFTFVPRSSGDIRVSLALNDGLLPCSAEGRRTNVIPALGRPSVSGKLRAKKTLTFKGTLLPGHRGKVRVAFSRTVRGKLKPYKTYTVYTNSTGRWTLRAKLPKGDWRIRSGHADTDHLQGWSSYRSLRIKG